MHRLITYHAELNRMLFRSHADLYEHIKAGQVAGEPGSVTPVDPLPDSAPASLSQLLVRLKHLGTTLTDLQRLIQQDIRAVELSLTDQR